MERLQTGWLAGCGVLGMLVGCHSQPSTAPTLPAELANGAVARSGLVLSESFQVVVDPLGLSAQIAPAPSRSLAAQPPQALTYQLEISRFLRPTDFVITAVRRGLGNDIELDWRQAHPFPAPNLSAPITAKNRADLGYTGYLLNLGTNNTTDFFEGTVHLGNLPGIDPDLFLTLGDLGESPFDPDEVFPAWLLVDEARDSREGISNGGSDTGSYDAGGGGWQRANLGTEGLGWTGFDYLHGGQATTGSLMLRPPQGPSPFVLDLAYLIKWTDPRGIGGMTARFPSDPADVFQFAYRNPFGALDISQIIAPGLLIVDRSAGASTDLALAVRDWDQGATTSGDANLGDEPDVSAIQPGAAAAPSVRVDLSRLLGIGTPPITLAHIGGTGRPRDPLRYTGSFTHATELPVTEDFGLIEVVDPEDADPAAVNYRFGVDPDTLVPDAARALPVRSYQLLRVQVKDPGSSSESIFATVAPTSGPHAGESGISEVSPTAAVDLDQTYGTRFGTAMADAFGPWPNHLLCVSPAGDVSSLDWETPPGQRRARPLSDFRCVHPSLAPDFLAEFPGQIPFLCLEAANPPALIVGDFLTGQRLITFTGLPAALPSLTASGEALFADLAGPDWNQADTHLGAVALGTGITVAAAIPPLTARGNIYTFDPTNPAPTFTNLTNFSNAGGEGGFYPDWSSDGSQIVFVHVQVNILNLPRSFKLAILDVASGNVTDLNLTAMGTPPAPATAYVPIHPSFASDGRITFAALEVNLTAQEVLDSDIWVYDPTGPTITNVSDTDDAFEGYPFFK